MKGKYLDKWSKSGSIVSRYTNGKIIATKVNGKYWMYWGELHVYAATSTNLVDWLPLVNEDGTWMRVKDTKHGKSLGDDLNTVYVFGSENRRILINGILFTDYFETTEQEKLINDEKDFFNNWKTYENKIDQDNINILIENLENLNTDFAGRITVTFVIDGSPDNSGLVLIEKDMDALEILLAIAEPS